MMTIEFQSAKFERRSVTIDSFFVLATVMTVNQMAVFWSVTPYAAWEFPHKLPTSFIFGLMGVALSIFVWLPSYLIFGRSGLTVISYFSLIAVAVLAFAVARSYWMLSKDSLVTMSVLLVLTQSLIPFVFSNRSSVIMSIKILFFGVVGCVAGVFHIYLTTTIT